MSENTESKFIRLVCYAVPFLLVAYVMSIGPVAALVLDSKGDVEYPQYMGQIESFYAPLEWCADKSEYVGNAFRAYIHACNGTVAEYR